jgi:hypothetical protein
MPYQSVGVVKFTSELQLEGSWGGRRIGAHECEMEFFLAQDRKRGFIEWTYTNRQGAEDVTTIGLVFRGRELVDYDGIMGFLPTQAVSMLTRAGYKVGAEFRG